MVDKEKIKGCGEVKEVELYGEKHFFIETCSSPNREKGTKHLFREQEMETSERRFGRAEEGAKLIKDIE